MYFRQLIPVLAAIGLAQGTYAEELQPVEVVDTRIERQSIAEVDLEQYNGFASVISRDSFADRLVNVTDVINAMPSVQTYNSGGMGTFSAASIRGSSGRQVNVFIDGILLNSALSGSANLGVIPSSIIETIEIYPDYTPVQLSDANLAGAINIRTRALAAGENGGQLGLGFGSFNTRKTEGSYWGGNAGTDIIAAASMTASDNDFPVSKDMFPDVTSGNSRHRENAAFEQGDAFARLRHALNDELNMQFMANYTSSDNEIPTIQNRNESAATLDTETLRSSMGIETNQDNHNWGSRLYTVIGETVFRDLAQSIAMQVQHITQRENTLGANVFHESAIGKQVISTTLDISHADIEKRNESGAEERIDAKRDKLVAALSDTWMPTAALSVYGVLRGYHVQDQTEAGTAAFSAACAGNDNECLDSEHNEASWQAGIAFEFSNHWRIKGNMGRLLRIPSLAEKYGELGNYIGEPDLQPETANSIDAGLLFESTALTLEHSIYYRQVEDGIYIAYDARGVGHPDNISESRVLGTELASHWKISKQFSLGLSGYAMDSENLSGIKANHGKKMHGIYHNGYAASLTWATGSHTTRSNSTGSHSIVTTFQVDDELYYTAANTAQADQKDSLDISYTYYLQHWSFNAGISNVLDNQYSDYNRMPTTGRFYNTSIHYEF